MAILNAEDALKQYFWNGKYIEIHSGDISEIVEVINNQCRLNVRAALDAVYEEASNSDLNCGQLDRILKAYSEDLIK